MSTTLVATHYDHDSMGINWRPMLMLSMVFHVIAVLIILFVPNSIPSRHFPKGVIYEVDLVEMPDSARSRSKKANAVDQSKKRSVVKNDKGTKRIQLQEAKEKPLVISKRTTTRDITKINKPDVTPPKIIDKIEPKKEEELNPAETSHLRDAISRLREKVATDSTGTSAETPGPAAPTPNGGISMRIYQMEVETKIKSNWAYPTALVSRKDLEAVVLVKVQRDGTILKYELIKRSYNSMFDQSVITAIERTKSMPPFPEGFRQNDEEIEITFNIKDF